MSWGRGFNKSHPCSEQETPEGEKKVPAPRHTLPFIRQNSWETLKWSSAGIENMDFGLSWAWVRIPTTSRLCDFRQPA